MQGIEVTHLLPRGTDPLLDEAFFADDVRVWYTGEVNNEPVDQSESLELFEATLANQFNSIEESLLSKSELVKMTKDAVQKAHINLELSAQTTPPSEPDADVSDIKAGYTIRFPDKQNGRKILLPVFHNKSVQSMQDKMGREINNLLKQISDLYTLMTRKAFLKDEFLKYCEGIQNAGALQQFSIYEKTPKKFSFLIEGKSYFDIKFRIRNLVLK